MTIVNVDASREKKNNKNTSCSRILLAGKNMQQRNARKYDSRAELNQSSKIEFEFLIILSSNIVNLVFD